MTKKPLLALALLAAVLGTGCADLDETSHVGVHPPDWSTPGSDRSHAVALSEQGLPNAAQDCAVCHGADYGVPESDCFQCHRNGAVAGHPESVWRQGLHGQAVVDAGSADGCGNCHAWDLGDRLDFDQGGWSQQSCRPCHGSSFPHPPDWSTPGAAGNHASQLAVEGLPNSARICAACHGDYYGAPDEQCFVCHGAGQVQGHPGTGFVSPSGVNFHGQGVIDAGGYGACGDCHAWEAGGEVDFGSGGWSQQPCDTCHGGGPSGHPATVDWMDPASSRFHGQAAAGPAITECAACHGADYLGGWTGVSCNACHPVSADIHAVGWVERTDTPGSHGYFIDQGDLRVDDCRACHGADLTGGWAGQSCGDCH